MQKAFNRPVLSIELKILNFGKMSKNFIKVLKYQNIDFSEGHNFLVSETLGKSCVSKWASHNTYAHRKSQRFSFVNFLLKVYDIS